jgi:co-chaperonin GroES (HSP10)
VEDKTAGGLLLTEATKEKPSIGTVSGLCILHE